MKTKIMLTSFLLVLTSIHTIIAQKIGPDKIEDLRIRQNDVPNEFILHQERLTKLGTSTNEQIYQFWRRESLEKDFVLIEEEKRICDNLAGASSFQKWYRDNKTGVKDKIQIDIIICPSDSLVNRTIDFFTIEAFSSQFNITETPIAGERSWIPKFEHPRGDNFTIMFLKYNVFVRLFVILKDKNKKEVEQVTENIARSIENRIIM